MLGAAAFVRQRFVGVALEEMLIDFGIAYRLRTENGTGAVSFAEMAQRDYCVHAVEDAKRTLQPETECGQR